MRLQPRKTQQRVIEFEERTDVVFLIRHARRFFTDLFFFKSSSTDRLSEMRMDSADSQYPQREFSVGRDG